MFLSHGVSLLYETFYVQQFIFPQSVHVSGLFGVTNSSFIDSVSCLRLCELLITYSLLLQWTEALNSSFKHTISHLTNLLPVSKTVWTRVWSQIISVPDLSPAHKQSHFLFFWHSDRNQNSTIYLLKPKQWIITWHVNILIDESTMITWS